MKFNLQSKKVFNEKHDRTYKRIVTAGAIGTIIATACSITWANTAAEARPLALRTIMQGLSENMQTVTDAISREDWKQVVKTAPLIADHPLPPLLEKVTILSFVGSDAGRFKGFNRQTHQAAKKLEDVARKQNGNVVITAFATLQSSCLACHQSFRKPFKEYFYGQQ
jgi:hypothetical protein